MSPSLQSRRDAPVGLSRSPRTLTNVPSVFRQAVGELASVSHHEDLVVSEIPAPRSAAPFAVALGAEVAAHHPVRASGRFMLLFDPEPRAQWGGKMRVVTYVQAELDEAMSEDPLLSRVAWDWLCEALDTSSAQHHLLGATTNKVLKQGFGTLVGEPAIRDIELRASWSPLGHLNPHLSAWQAMLAAFAGLPPRLDGIGALPGLRYS